MGLDVYLYRYEDKAAHDEWEKKYEAIDDFEKSQEWERSNPQPAREKIERPSAKHAGHLFKVGYLRSSYNAGGINNVCRRLIGEGHGLYSIFEPDGRYDFQPDWEKARERAANELDAMRAAASECLSVEKLTHNFLMAQAEYKVGSENQALAAYREQIAKAPARPGYSTRDGEFFEKPMKVLGVIYGRDAESVAMALSGRKDGWVPAVYLIYENDVSDLDWYVQALEITIETIDWVLNQPEAERQKLWLHWSA